MDRRQAAERHDTLLRELNEERAAALMRISRRLESLIDQLAATRQQIEHADAAERPRIVDDYRRLRRDALRHRWYLEVQREALGFRHHHLLDAFYRIPGPIEP